MDFVEFFDPTRRFYTLKPGTWVEFHKPGDFRHLAWHGYVRKIIDTLAFVIDEHTWNEVFDRVSMQTELTYVNLRLRLICKACKLLAHRDHPSPRKICPPVGWSVGDGHPW